MDSWGLRNTIEPHASALAPKVALATFGAVGAYVMIGSRMYTWADFWFSALVAVSAYGLTWAALYTIVMVSALFGVFEIDYVREDGRDEPPAPVEETVPPIRLPQPVRANGHKHHQDPPTGVLVENTELFDTMTSDGVTYGSVQIDLGAHPEMKDWIDKVRTARLNGKLRNVSMRKLHEEAGVSRVPDENGVNAAEIVKSELERQKLIVEFKNNVFNWTKRGQSAFPVRTIYIRGEAVPASRVDEVLDF